MINATFFLQYFQSQIGWTHGYRTHGYSRPIVLIFNSYVYGRYISYDKQKKKSNSDINSYVNT